MLATIDTLQFVKLLDVYNNYHIQVCVDVTHVNLLLKCKQELTVTKVDLS